MFYAYKKNYQKNYRDKILENIPSISMDKIRMVLELFLMNILVQMSTLEQSLVKKVIEQKVNDEFDGLALAWSFDPKKNV